jgi:hypothetical protein
MERICRSFLCLALWVTGAATYASPIVATPPVAGLTYSFTLHQHQGVILFTDVYPTDEQHPTTWDWTFSGCEATPTQSTDPGPTVTAQKPGILHAHAEVHVWDGTGYFTYADDLDTFVIGGPFAIGMIDRSQTREQRALSTLPAPWQPSILEYFDYDLHQVPTGMQRAN